MEPRLLECVPNFSEGRDLAVVERVAAAIRSTPGAWLLHVDSGKSANRTVMTIAGDPEAVCEAAFRAASQAARTIDMRGHAGAHPRIGALDVCPVVPLRGTTMAEAVDLARSLGSRLAEELDIPVYLYGEAALRPERASLASIRKGGYEALEAKFLDPAEKPDFGTKFNSKSGASAVGAREILVAYNVNLRTPSVEVAKRVAAAVRSLPGIRALGWYMEEYARVQVSMNLTGSAAMGVYPAFEAVRREAEKLGVEVEGSELIGLIPLAWMREAGSHFSDAQEDEDLVREAVQGLGLDALAPFSPNERILEYAIAAHSS